MNLKTTFSNIDYVPVFAFQTESTITKTETSITGRDYKIYSTNDVHTGDTCFNEAANVWANYIICNI